MKTINEKQNNVIDKQIRTKIVIRLIIDIILFLCLLATGTILLTKSFNFETEKIIRYYEKSSVDYKVYLEKNDFYDQEYLGKDMLYVASLIDKVLIDFDYKFESEEKESIDFTYSIFAKLSINNSVNTKSYFEKTYKLLDSKQANMVGANIQRIKEEISLDYPYYNSLANGFKNRYGVDVDSKLTVYMVINKKNADTEKFNLDNDSIMNLIIPLSEKSVDIKLDYKEIDETSNIIKKQNLTIRDYIPITVSVIFIIGALIMMIRAMRNYAKIYRKKSSYDKYVAKLLKEYDRLIAESESLISFENKEIININKFTELLDIHDNLQIPIMYYEVREHERSYFYINHTNVVYLFKVDANEMKEKK